MIVMMIVVLESRDHRVTARPVRPHRTEPQRGLLLRRGLVPRVALVRSAGDLPVAGGHAEDVAADEVEDGLQRGQRAAEDDEEELGRDPDEDVVRRPGEVFPVGELAEIGGLDARADRRPGTQHISHGPFFFCGNDGAYKMLIAKTIDS